ncbi:MAG TPA: MBL fold metallo-hydrolase [Acidobacteriaceae bacterium]|nr:MBL fold metallo-hydrolase [Acidobacteriaceae bacterium]
MRFRLLRNLRAGFSGAVILAVVSLGCLVQPTEAHSASDALPNGTITAPARPLRDLPATFVTLGTGGGPFIRLDRSESANAVVVGDQIYLFDVGYGVQRQMLRASLPLAKVRAIFLSHMHNDHNADLGAVIVQRWLLYNGKPMPVIGPPGTVVLVNAICVGNRATEGASATEGGAQLPPMGLSVVAKDMAYETDTPTVVYEDENIRVLAVINTHYHLPSARDDRHLPRSYSYRIETAHRVFVFTGDTGVSSNVERLAKGADVLISEVIDLTSMETFLGKLPAEKRAALMKHMREDHLTPTEVGELAARAGVKEVVLTHLSPGRDGETDLSGYTKGIDTDFKGPVHVARDTDRW